MSNELLAETGWLTPRTDMFNINYMESNPYNGTRKIFFCRSTLFQALNIPCHWNKVKLRAFAKPSSNLIKIQRCPYNSIFVGEKRWWGILSPYSYRLIRPQVRWMDQQELPEIFYVEVLVE